MAKNSFDYTSKTEVINKQIKLLEKSSKNIDIKNNAFADYFFKFAREILHFF